MPLVAISLGSSLGPRLQHLQAAVATLQVQPGLHLLHASRVSWTPPAGGVARSAFLNAVLKAETTLPPLSLLQLCKSLEARLGRRPARRYAERVIDVDLLLYGDQIVQAPALLVPHPRLAERDFFLDLLAEVWPSAPNPFSGRPWAEGLPPRRHWPRVGSLQLSRR